jgi:hypothetical protein
MVTEKQFIFLREITLQLRYAIEAVDRFHGAARDNDAEPIDLFRALDDFVHHLARVSLLLWPVKSADQARGAELRQVTSVEDGSPLSSRDLRNHLQHLDERLDKWLADNQPPAALMDMTVDCDAKVNGKRVVGLRDFSTTTNTYLFQGEEYKIEPLEMAARDLLARIKVIKTPFGPLIA